MHRAMFAYGLRSLTSLIREAGITFDDIVRVAESGSSFAIPNIKLVIETVGIPEVIAERKAFLDSIIVPAAVNAVNGWNYVYQLPNSYFDRPLPEVKRDFAKEMPNHIADANSVAPYLFAAIDSRLQCHITDQKIIEVFMAAIVRALEKDFKPTQCEIEE